MSIEAMKQMVEALERIKRYGNTYLYRKTEQNPYEQVCEAISAGRQAIKQSQDAALAEREACAKVCETYQDPFCGVAMADAIRARGNT